MTAGESSKAVACLVAAVAVVLSFFKFPLEIVGIYPDCPLSGRLLYSFFHANVLHSSLNSMCLLAVVFRYNTTPLKLLGAFLVAAAYPAATLASLPFSTSAPTIGLSGIVFALFGSISFSVARKLYWQKWMLFYIVLGFVAPYTNAWLHLWCYTVGFAWAFINRPLCRTL